MELAETFSAVACSRPIVDAKWLDKPRQVGTSRKTVKPKVYLALGISGSFQHLDGIKGNPFMVAVNKNPQAPIFQVATVGVVADLLELLPVLTESEHGSGLTGDAGPQGRIDARPIRSGVRLKAGDQALELLSTPLQPFNLAIELGASHASLLEAGNRSDDRLILRFETVEPPGHLVKVREHFSADRCVLLAHESKSLVEIRKRDLSVKPTQNR